MVSQILDHLIRDGDALRLRDLAEDELGARRVDRLELDRPAEAPNRREPPRVGRAFPFPRIGPTARARRRPSDFRPPRGGTSDGTSPPMSSSSRQGLHSQKGLSGGPESGPPHRLYVNAIQRYLG